MKLYTYKTTGNGYTVDIFRPDGTSVAYLMGLDAINLLNEIEKVESYEYPRGPFKSAEELVSVLLDQYDINEE